MKRFAAMLAVSVLMVLWIASGDRMSAGQRTDGLYYEVTGIHPDARADAHQRRGHLGGGVPVLAGL